MIKILLVIFLSFCSAEKCKIDDDWCVFTSVNLTETKLLFNPTADNPALVKKVKFEKSVMHTLTSEVCNAFPNLKELEVDQASLKKIAVGALANCSKLTDVSFWTNDLTELPVDVFYNNSLLETLTFQHNDLKEINPLTFKNLKKLKTIAINENYLVEFPVYKMPRIPSLVTLWIHHNELTDIDEQEILYKFPNIKTIYMEDNPFNCDRLKVILATFQRKLVTIDRWHDSPRDRKYTLTTVDSVDCLSDAEREKYLSKDRVTELKNEIDAIEVEIERINNLKAELNNSLTEIDEKSTKLTEKIGNFEKESGGKSISELIDTVNKLKKEAIETSRQENDEKYEQAMKVMQNLEKDVRHIENSSPNAFLVVVVLIILLVGVLAVVYYYRRKKELAGFRFSQTRDDVEFNSSSTTNIFTH